MKNDTLRPIEKSPMTNMNLQSFSTLSAVPQYATTKTSKFTFQALVCAAYSHSGSTTIRETNLF